MSGLNWPSLEAARPSREPFDYLHVADALTPAAAEMLPGEFPAVPGPGSFALSDAPPGPVMSAVIEGLLSDRFRAVMSNAFDVDLAGRPTTITIRGESGARDGFIHTDSKSKILSLLLYMNDGWTGGEGQLRLLRGPHDIDDVAFETPAHMGSLVAFRRTDNSWHGHTPFHGRRRVLQLNYVKSDRTTLVSDVRHRLSAMMKRQAVA